MCCVKFKSRITTRWEKKGKASSSFLFAPSFPQFFSVCGVQKGATVVPARPPLPDKAKEEGKTFKE